MNLFTVVEIAVQQEAPVTPWIATVMKMKVRKRLELITMIGAVHKLTKFLTKCRLKE